MRLVKLIFFLVFCSVGATRQTRAEPSDASSTVRQIEARFHQAFVNGDTKEFETLLTREFVWMHGTGEIASKQQLIESFRSGKSRYKRDEIDNVKITLYNAGAVVVGHDVRELGTGEVLDFNYTTTYVKEGEAWQIAVFHSSHCPCK
jgi:hypothetical protein